MGSSETAAVPPYNLIQILAMLGTAVLVAWSYSKTKKSASGDADRAFVQFRNKYLIVYLLMVMGDWLQGPYVYALYDTYGFTKADIAVLFVIGFGASMLFGTFVGSLADSNGRKKFCLLYCALYIGSCATKHFNDYYILLLGRLLGGTATSLLFSVFESWLVCAHNARGFGEERLGQIFTWAIFGNSVIAIASGFVAQFAADAIPMSGGPYFYWGGLTGPFDLASIVLIVGALVMSFSWEENYGERQEGGALSAAALKQSLAILKTDPNILLCGLVQSCFEGAMYSFVFEWTPALTPAGYKPPYGTIFATFMVCCMAGSQLVGYVLSKKGSPHNALTLVFLISAASLASAPIDKILGTGFTYYGFLLFEFCVGLYWPLVSMMKSAVVPEEHRSTLYNIFRVPLNAIVLFVLLNNFDVETTFVLCVALLFIAAFLQSKLAANLNNAKHLEESERVGLSAADTGM